MVFESTKLLVSYFSLKNSTPTQYFNTPVNWLFPKAFWDAWSGQNASYHVKNCTILPLTHIMSLWCITYVNSLQITFIAQNPVNSLELNSPPQSVPRILIFFQDSFSAKTLNCLNGIKASFLLLQKLNTRLPAIVISKRYKIPFIGLWGCIDWTIEVWVNQLQQFLSPPCFPYRKWSTMLFTSNKALTNFGCNIDLGKTTNHILLLQGSLPIKIEVSISHMPKPNWVHHFCCQVCLVITV